MRLEYDPEADAAYVYLSDAKRTSGKHLDDARYIDYDAAHRPVGVEFLGVSHGVNLDGVPERDAIMRLLDTRHIKLYLCTFCLATTCCCPSSVMTTISSGQKPFYLTIIEKCKDSGLPIRFV